MRVLRDWVDRLGAWGPLAIIALMMTAIVMSPIPSGPIAMVAGAAYESVWGTLYVVLGVEAGALFAFWVTRCLGYDMDRRWGRIRPLPLRGSISTGHKRG